jgi:pimeloyl-[acyl-carrier protein] methyl ester esterase
MKARAELPRLVLVHGWAQHGGVWQTWQHDLAPIARIRSINLPGHGGTPWDRTIDSLDRLADSVLPALAEPAAIAGWSLGGMIALNLARRYPDRVMRVILCNTTPRFTAGDDWPHGIAAALLEDFRDRIDTDTKQVLRDFLSLQLRGERHSRRTLQLLRGSLADGGHARGAALRFTLDLLAATDLRAVLGEVACPALVIASSGDAVTPAAAGSALAAALPDARCLMLDSCGHAGFLSRPAQLGPTLGAFLNGGRAVERAS